MAAKYSLESLNFATNLSASLTSLLNGSFLCDITLVCDDGQLSAHKVILAASSSFFSSVFQLNPHNHPLMYLRGVKTEQMQSVLQFLYAGSTAMKEEEVSSFLSVAADLKIVGLMGNAEEQQLVLDAQNLVGVLPSVENDRKSIIPASKQEYIPDESSIENNPELVEKKVFITKQPTSSEKVPILQTKVQLQSPIKTSGKNQTVSAVLENRPNISMISNPNPVETHMSPKVVASPTKKPIRQQRINVANPNGNRRILTIPPQTRRSIPVPSIFCPICQTTDRKSSTIKMHMESKREVQCKACTLYFGNCFSLGKHMKGRCREKKAKEEKKRKAAFEN